MGQTRQVRREDGTLEPLKERKVADSILRALRATGISDRVLAEELAGVVVLFLDRYHVDGIPTEDELEEMMCQVLRETGHPQAADRCRELLQEQRRLEQEVTVRYLPAVGEPGTPDRENILPWRRERLIRSLTRRGELPPSLAEEISAAVEGRIAEAGLRCVTPALIRELVSYEYLDRGLRSRPPGELRYGFEQDELQELLATPRPESPDRVIASRVLESYALNSIHGEDVARAHLDGRIHLYGLSDPFKVERLSVPATLVFPRDWRTSPVAETLLHVRRTLSSLRGYVRTEIVLDDMVAALATHPDAAAAPERLARLILDTLDFRDAYGEMTVPHCHLTLPLVAVKEGGLECCLLERLFESSDQGEWLPLTLVYRDGMDLASPGIEKTLEGAAQRKATSLCIERGEPSSRPPGAQSRPVALTISLGRVAINLPLALLDAQGTSLKDDVLPELGKSCHSVLAAFHEHFWHQRGGSRQGLHGVVVRLGGPGQVQVSAQDQEVDLEIWGLTHGLEMLVRRGVIPASGQVDAAASILGYLDYLVGEEQNGVRFRVRLGATRDRVVRRRLLGALEEAGDRYGIPEVQALIKDDKLNERSTLPVVVPLFSPRNDALLKASFADRAGPGLLLPLTAFEGKPATVLRRLAKETRLGLLSLAPRRPGEDLFEVQEELFA